MYVYDCTLSVFYIYSSALCQSVSPVLLDCRAEMLHFVLFFKTPPQLPASSLILHTQLKNGTPAIY